MFVRTEREYDTTYKKCIIEIDGASYPATFQEHRLVSEGFDINGNMLVNYTTIRKYVLGKPHPLFKTNLFEVLCDDGHKSMCYMTENKKTLIEVN